jgi:hypothetical protein
MHHKPLTMHANPEDMMIRCAWRGSGKRSDVVIAKDTASWPTNFPVREVKPVKHGTSPNEN